MKEFEGKKLLVLGSVILEKDIVERAQKMGAYVAVADYYEDSPAKEFAHSPLSILCGERVSLSVETSVGM